MRISDWSSDVCSSDLSVDEPKEPAAEGKAEQVAKAAAPAAPKAEAAPAAPAAAAPAAKPAAATAETAAIDPAGEKLYKSVCFACHAAGVAGAPKFGDKAAWAPLIEQGMDSKIGRAHV